MGFEMKREVKGDTEDLGHSNWKDGVFPMDSGVTVVEQFLQVRNQCSDEQTEARRVR